MKGDQMTFSSDAWERAKPWYQAILEHAFLRELADGTLPREVFLRYIVDDTHYLSRYSRALASTSAKWPEAAGAAVIAGFAAASVEAEQVLHQAVMAQEGIDMSAASLPEPTPTCLAYVNTLQADASLAPAGVALAGLLPCFRIYAEVGQHLVGVLATYTGGAGAHPYEEWLRMYGDPEFAEATRQAERLADEQAERDPVAVEAMHRAYGRAVRFEWMFWDASYRSESWPAPSEAGIPVAAGKVPGEPAGVGVYPSARV